MKPLQECILCVVARADVKVTSNGVLFHTLDGTYLDSIAQSYKEMRILVSARGNDMREENSAWQYTCSSQNITFIPMATKIGLGCLGSLRFLGMSVQEIAKADMVYIFMPTWRGVFSALIARILGKPYSVYAGLEWVGVLKEKKWSGVVKKIYTALYNSIEYFVMKHSDIRLVHGIHMVEKYQHLKGRTIETKPLIVLAPKRLPQKNDTCTHDIYRVLMVNAVIPRKGIEYAIDAIALLKKKGINAELIIVGATTDDSYGRDLNERINKHRCADIISFKGYIPQGKKLYAFYSECDMLLMCSLSEGFPRVIYEAFYFGLPVIASAIDAIKQGVETQGLPLEIVEPGDACSIAAGIERVIDDKLYRQLLIKRGQDYVKNLLTITPAQQYVSIVKEYYGVI